MWQKKDLYPDLPHRKHTEGRLCPFPLQAVTHTDGSEMKTSAAPEWGTGHMRAGAQASIWVILFWPHQLYNRVPSFSLV